MPKMADKENKKRKRAPSLGDSPFKKVALDASNTTDNKIRVSFRDEKQPPVILATPGLHAPRVKFKSYAKPFRVSSRGAGSTHYELLLQSSEHPRLDYVAASNNQDQKGSHYVAVFDPVAKQLQITAAHHLSLCATLRSEALEIEHDKLTHAQQREELGREFGTKKAKKAIVSRTENAIIGNTQSDAKASGVQTAVLEFMKDTVAGSSTNKAEEEATAFAAKPIPKPNVAAQSVEDVYTYGTLVPPHDDRLVNIKDWQEKTHQNEEIRFLHRFPAFRVAGIGKGDEVLKLKALRYLTLLLEFHDTLGNSRGGRKVPQRDVLSKKLSAWPQQLVDSVRRRFTNDMGTELGKWQMDNLYTHMCALSLYVDGWSTNTTDLKNDLKMEQRQMSQYFHELGCKVGAPTEAERSSKGISKALAATTRIAKLKLPLDFPKPRIGKRRKTVM